MLNARELLQTHNLALITLDTLRYDVAVEALARGETPCLAGCLPGGVWERRHSPGNFTFAAHQAFFAGFLPTPASPGKHPRLFACEFPGAETIASETWVCDAGNIVEGFAEAGFYTLCIGGVGFFNLFSPLGRVLPGLFQESRWRPEFGVTHPHSTEEQVTCAVERLAAMPAGQQTLLFLNVSALHQPNCHYLPGATADSAETQRAALAYVDRCLPPLFAALQRRGPTLMVICSDHGTAYGEDGYWGHRLCHETVWTVPYAEFVLPGEAVP